MKRSALKPLFWKEWHENIRWAVLVLLGLTLSLTYAVYHEVGERPAPNDGSIPIWGSVNLVMTIGAPLAGIALGLLQILPELRRDQWAFLVHRPASRTILFWGKVLPGLCLYLLATIPPLLGVAAWDAAPGHVAAPFDFRFTLGGWAAILSGLPFYFAGLLVALRPARWYGSRALPILGAIFAPLAANALAELWQVIVVCIMVSGVLVIAAWGSFVTSGDYGSQTKPARFMLGVTLGAGVVVCVIALLGVSVTMYQSLFPRSTNIDASTQYQVDESGRILRVTYTGSEMKGMDLQGHVLFTQQAVNGGWPETQSVSFLNFSALVTPWPQDSAPSPLYNNSTRYVLPLQTFQYQRADTAWYYVYRTNQVVGYSMQTRQRIGCLGPNGFSQSGESAGQFAEPLTQANHRDNTVAILQFPHAVYQFDTDKQTLIKLWSSTSAAKLDGICPLTGIGAIPPPGIGAVAQHDTYAIAAGNQIQVFSGAGTLLFTLPRTFPASAYPVIQAAMNPAGNRYYLWYGANGSNIPGVGFSYSTLVTAASNGHVLTTTNLPALMPAWHQIPTPALTGLLMSPVLPLAYVSIGVISPDMRDFWRSLRQDTGIPGVLTLSLLSGVIAAVLAWRISRRCGDSRRGQILWAAGVFWLGGYGVLLLLALRAWPARIPCPNCKRLRAVDRTECEHCGAPFARPVQDGTEIFDADEAVVVR